MKIIEQRALKAEAMSKELHLAKDSISLQFSLEMPDHCQP